MQKYVWQDSSSSASSSDSSSSDVGNDSRVRRRARRACQALAVEANKNRDLIRALPAEQQKSLMKPIKANTLHKLLFECLGFVIDSSNMFALRNICTGWQRLAREENLQLQLEQSPQRGI